MALRNARSTKQQKILLRIWNCVKFHAAFQIHIHPAILHPPNRPTVTKYSISYRNTNCFYINSTNKGMTQSELKVKSLMLSIWTSAIITVVQSLLGESTRRLCSVPAWTPFPVISFHSISLVRQTRMVSYHLPKQCSLRRTCLKILVVSGCMHASALCLC